LGRRLQVRPSSVFTIGTGCAARSAYRGRLR
jgi:hypothetical protein